MYNAFLSFKWLWVFLRLMKAGHCHAAQLYMTREKWHGLNTWSWMSAVLKTSDRSGHVHHQWSACQQVQDSVAHSGAQARSPRMKGILMNAVL